MKENISHDETKYIKRRLAIIVREAIERFSVVVISGARQVGKSTMLTNEFSDFTYFTLDNFDTVDMIKTDPSFIFKQHDFIIIDEAQKLPAIFNAIKLAVDNDKNKRIIISGSSNILLMKNITESLAGRALYFEMMPITFGEINGILTPTNFLNLWKDNYTDFDIKNIKINENIYDSKKFLYNDKKSINENKKICEIVQSSSLVSLMMKGFMPRNIMAKDQNDVTLWLDGYVKTYLERDLRDLSQVESIIDFRKVMQVLALRTGNILNQADVSRDTGISNSTVYRYIKLLEISNIIERVPGFFTSKGKRITKSPKIYFVDPALSIFLSGYFDEESLNHSRELGGYFETTVFFHLKCLCEMLKPSAKIHYWRTVSGKEVDFILEYGKKLLAIEVKITKNPLVKDIKNLLIFMDDHPETVIGILLHSGSEIKRLNSKVIAVPWQWIDCA
ncbi:MAG: ATP-binding protein [bacterium]